MHSDKTRAILATIRLSTPYHTAGISLHDVTEELTGLVEKSKVLDGWVNLVSQHTTTGVMINEMESRLVDDFRHFLMKMAPASQPYLHNDIHARPASQADMDAIIEPRNAHAHLMTMLVGATETIPIVDGKLAIGSWQSVILVDSDGPRKRRLGVQIIGTESQ
eukprot:jgi/Bigna1/40399/e_gw1.42.59.1